MPKRIVLLLFLLVSIPYFSAFLSVGDNHQFVGFLINPQDGNSYLAKMYQGWRGEWKFTLPFTSDPGEGEYLFTFYIALGHLSRILGIPLWLGFHLARIAAAIFLAWMVWQFLEAVHPESPYQTLIFSVAILGAGMGWLVFPFGVLTSDFWIAEAFPFLSAYTNPHFCLSLALILWLIQPVIRLDEKRCPKQNYKYLRCMLAIAASVFLTSISPFSFVLLTGIVLCVNIWDVFSELGNNHVTHSGLKEFLHLHFERIKSIFSHLFWIILGGLPMVLYTVLVTQSNSVLRIWNEQNVTLSPPPWDLMIAFSPALFFAIPGAITVLRTGNKRGRAVIVWAVFALILAYAPLNLQRRFLLGLFVPLVVLAGYGLDWLSTKKASWIKWGAPAMLALSLPTTVLTLLIGQFGVKNLDPLLYLENREANALEWIRINTADHAIILANPRLGLFIPGQTGRRVIYGHEYETVNARQEKLIVERFFQDASNDPITAGNLLLERRVDYVLFVSQKHYNGVLDQVPRIRLIFNQDDALIFRVINQ